jgi:hypothetical protein
MNIERRGFSIRGQLATDSEKRVAICKDTEFLNEREKNDRELKEFLHATADSISVVCPIFE